MKRFPLWLSIAFSLELHAVLVLLCFFASGLQEPVKPDNAPKVGRVPAEFREHADWLEEKHGIALRGSWNSEGLTALDGAYSRMPAAVIRPASVLTICDDDGHYADPEVKCVAAHCHAWNGNVCYRGQYAGDMAYHWHEVAHAYTDTLGTADWERVAGSVYGKANGLYVQTEAGGFVWREEDGGGSRPLHGILDPYGARNANEDIAVWVENCYLTLAGSYSDLDTLKQGITDLKYAGKPVDPRYHQKLALLGKYGFLVEADVRTLEKYVK
jgi:hypothetical protein